MGRDHDLACSGNGRCPLKGEVNPNPGRTERGLEDCGGASTTSAPVYAVTDEDGQTEIVDTRDLKIVR
jgi:hypothetical protein